MRCLLSSLAVALFLSFVPNLRADATFGYKTTVELGPLLKALSSPGRGGDPVLPPVSLVQIKGDKAYSNAFLLPTRIDFGSRQITLLDAASQRFSTVAAEDYWQQISEILPLHTPPPFQNLLRAAQVGASCQPTGRTAAIVEIQVEETECVLSMSVPIDFALPGIPPAPVEQAFTVFKLVMQRWSPAPAEVSRVAALTEFRAASPAMPYALNPAFSLQQALTRIPMIGPHVAAVLEDLPKDQPVILKSHLEIYIPALAQVLPFFKARIPLSEDFDPAAAIVTVETEATEISSAPLEASLFQIPATYRPVPLSDLLKSLLPPGAQQHSAASAAPATADSAASPSAGPIGTPSCIYCPAPQYTRQASHNKIAGTIVLEVIIHPDGHATDIKVVQGLGYGLDEAAVHAVEHWQFSPAKDATGTPVTTRTPIEVTFRLR